MKSQPEAVNLVRPLHYDITFNLDYKSKNYNGTVDILLRVLEKCDSMVLHASPTLSIYQQCSVTQNKKTKPAKANQEGLINQKESSKPKKKFHSAQKSTYISENQPTNDSLRIQLSQPLDVGKACLKLGFKGVFRSDRRGIYWCPKQRVLCTHFEPSFARTAFPCFDNEKERATFSLTLTGVPLNENVISNMPIQSENVSQGVRKVSFTKTPSMPPYLFAFAVGNFPYCKQEMHHGIPVTVFSTTGVSVDLVLQTVLKSLKTLEEYFQEDYNLPKLDVVIVPEHCIGGMENWGCIFLNEAACQTNKKDKNHEKLIELVVHEVAHQWLGNLVGLPFWIKEGLAQYFEKLVADKMLNRKSASYQHNIKALVEKESDKQQQDIRQEFLQKFNGTTYDQSLFRIQELANRHKTKFSSILQNLIQQYQNQYVSEEVFAEFFK